MSTRTNEPATKTPLLQPPPHCPNCDKEMTGVGLYQWQAGPWLIMSCYCYSCKKIFHTGVIPVAMAPDPHQKPSIPS